VPVVPWEGARRQGAPDQLANFYHAVLTFERFSVGLNVTMTKKGRQLFGGKKCTPRKNPGYAYDKSPPPPYVGMGPPNG